MFEGLKVSWAYSFSDKAMLICWACGCRSFLLLKWRKWRFESKYVCRRHQDEVIDAWLN